VVALGKSGGVAISVEFDRPGTGGEVKPLETGRPIPADIEPATIEGLFHLYLDSVYRFIYRQVGNQHDAEDLTSEVFLKAVRGLDSRRGSGAIGRWLFTVSRSVVADHWRRRYRIPPLVDIDDLELVAGQLTGNSVDAPDGKTQLVERVLAGLPDRYALVLRLRFLHGYSIVETAAEMGITVGNAKITQHRALEAAVCLVEDMK